jgi:hypothetical protein
MEMAHMGLRAVKAEAGQQLWQTRGRIRYTGKNTLDCDVANFVNNFVSEFSSGEVQKHYNS